MIIEEVKTTNLVSVNELRDFWGSKAIEYRLPPGFPPNWFEKIRDFVWKWLYG